MRCVPKVGTLLLSQFIILYNYTVNVNGITTNSILSHRYNSGNSTIRRVAIIFNDAPKL